MVPGAFIRSFTVSLYASIGLHIFSIPCFVDGAKFSMSAFSVAPRCGQTNKAMVTVTYANVVSVDVGCCRVVRQRLQHHASTFICTSLQTTQLSKNQQFLYAAAPSSSSSSNEASAILIRCNCGDGDPQKTTSDGNYISSAECCEA